MTAKLLEERIAENQKKQEQLKEQEKILTKRFNEEERRKRTRRLIEMGGIVEHVLERKLNDDDKTKFCNTHIHSLNCLPEHLRNNCTIFSGDFKNIENFLQCTFHIFHHHRPSINPFAPPSGHS